MASSNSYDLWMGKTKNKMLDDDNMAHYTKQVDITKRKENKKVMDNKMVSLKVNKTKLG